MCSCGYICGATNVDYLVDSCRVCSSLVPVQHAGVDHLYTDIFALAIGKGVVQVITCTVCRLKVLEFAQRSNLLFKKKDLPYSWKIWRGIKIGSLATLFRTANSLFPQKCSICR